MKSRLKLGTLLLLSFAGMVAVSLVIGSVGYYGAARSQLAIHETGAVRLQGVDSLLLTSANVERIRRVIGELARADISNEERGRLYTELTALREQYRATLSAYEALPKTAEEAELAKAFTAALANWRTANNGVLELSKKFEAEGIINPDALAAKVEQLTKDHYIVTQKVLLLLRSGENTFPGGDDHTACNAGKWLPTFQTKSASLMAAVQGIREPHQHFHVAIGRIKQLVKEGQSAEAARLFETEMVPAMQQVFAHFDSMRTAVAQALAIQREMEQAVHGSAETEQRKAVPLLEKLVQLNRDIANRTVQDSTTQGAFLKRFTLIAMTLGAAVAAVCGMLVTRFITSAIKRIAAQLSSGADHTSSAAEQVSSSSQDLASGASEQAAAVEETSSSLEELSSMTKRNAESANKANELAKQARAAAEKGATGMQTMTVAMQAIKTSSDDVAKIIKTIDEIAFQTNILALNAAVEAARAGESGMGFAVVAEEVRNLAQRSAQAAKDTADKIAAAIANTGQGVAISAQVGEALGEIVERARQVNELVSEVATASSEQTQGIAQINSAVSQMDKVVQTNAAGAEESAAAARELSDQAVRVRENVEELLRLIGGHGAPAENLTTSTKQAIAPQLTPSATATLLGRTITGTNADSFFESSDPVVHPPASKRGARVRS